MSSAIGRLQSLNSRRDRLRLFERLLQHLEHGLETVYPHTATTDRSEMLDAVDCRAAAAGEGEMDEALLVSWPSRAGKTGYRDREVRMGAPERALSHRARDDFRNGIVAVQQLRIDSQELGLRLPGVSDEAPVEPVAAALDVGEQRSEHAAGAAFGSRDLELTVADRVHQPVRLLVQMIGKRRLER